MSDQSISKDPIEEIRKRHERNSLPSSKYQFADSNPLEDAHWDRATLLAKVDELEGLLQAYRDYVHTLLAKVDELEGLLQSKKLAQKEAPSERG